jgi:hypothetical protein
MIAASVSAVLLLLLLELVPATDAVAAVVVDVLVSATTATVVIIIVGATTVEERLRFCVEFAFSVSRVDLLSSIVAVLVSCGRLLKFEVVSLPSPPAQTLIPVPVQYHTRTTIPTEKKRKKHGQLIIIKDRI